jgi:hypothetical protein
MIDAHATVLLSSKINDVANVMAGDTHALRGSFPVNIPFDIPVDGSPTDLNDLITKKYQGILAIYPGFNHILFDEQVDALDWGSSSGSTTLGSRQTNSIRGNSSDYLTTTVQTLASTPTTAVLRYEFFQYIESDPASGQYTRAYQDITTAGDIVVEVSFNGGTTMITASNGVLVNIPLNAQGNQFLIQIHRTAGTPAYIGSWAIVY